MIIINLKIDLCQLFKYIIDNCKFRIMNQIRSLNHLNIRKNTKILNIIDNTLYLL